MALFNHSQSYGFSGILIDAPINTWQVEHNALNSNICTKGGGLMPEVGKLSVFGGFFPANGIEFFSISTERWISIDTWGAQCLS